MFSFFSEKQQVSRLLRVKEPPGGQKSKKSEDSKDFKSSPWRIQDEEDGASPGSPLNAYPKLWTLVTMEMVETHSECQIFKNGILSFFNQVLHTLSTEKDPDLNV